MNLQEKLCVWGTCLQKSTSCHGGLSQPAARPLNSRLSKESLDEAGFPRLPHWKDALQRYLSELAIAEEEGVLKAF